MSLAVELIDQIVAVAASHGMKKVDEVTLEIGVLRQVVPDIMRAAFTAAGEGTLTEGARLRIVAVPARARCRKCGEEFAPQPHNFLCPCCRIADARVIRGDDIILQSVSGSDITGE